MCWRVDHEFTSDHYCSKLYGNFYIAIASAAASDVKGLTLPKYAYLAIWSSVDELVTHW